MDAVSNDNTPAAAPLVIWERLVCAVAGIAASAAGTVAVFVSENSIGTGVLLAVGAFFLLIGATGHPVERARLGDNEIQFARRLERTVASTLENAPEEIKPRLAEAILQASDDPVSQLSSRARSILFEHEVLAALHRALQDHLDKTSIAGTTIDIEDDAVIHRRDGKVISVILKATSRPVSATDVKAAADRRRVIPVLIVSRSGFTQAAHHEAARLNTEGPPVALATWISPSDDDDLRAVVLALWDQLSE